MKILRYPPMNFSNLNLRELELEKLEFPPSSIKSQNSNNNDHHPKSAPVSRHRSDSESEDLVNPINSETNLKNKIKSESKSSNLSDEEILKSKFGNFFQLSRVSSYSGYQPERKKHSKVKVNYCRNVNWKLENQKRAGVIVYTTYKNQLIFGLGIDSQSGNVTDFGGQVNSQDSSPLTGGLREFSEETLNVFGFLTEEQVSDFVVVYSSEMLIVFAHLNFDLKTTHRLFESRMNSLKKTEISSLVWLSDKQFFQLITTGYSQSEYRMSNSPPMELINNLYMLPPYDPLNSSNRLEYSVDQNSDLITCNKNRELYHVIRKFFSAAPDFRDLL